VTAGLRVVPDARVSRIERKNGRYVVRFEDGRRLECESIVLAAGAIETPALLLRSGLGGDRVGRGLRLHPAALVFARFSERVEAWRGVPQAVLVNEHASYMEGKRGGFLLMPNAATQPAFVAASLNSIGREHRRRMSGYENLASTAVLLHDEDGGRVHVRRGRTRIAYTIGDRDSAELAGGIEAAARLFFAAGAREVYLPFLHSPVTSERELQVAMSRHRVAPHRVILNAVHPQSSCAVGAAAGMGAVRPDGRLWRESGIYVADASLFPTSIGVPPQVTVMSAARMVAEAVASRYAA
jgi:choline dehydrogenase-like flavoprotein